MSTQLRFSSQPTSSLTGTLRAPGDKSISHRALILASLALGTCEIDGLLVSDDVLATAQALRDMGAHIQQADQIWTVKGVGVGGLCQPNGPLDFGNSGTSARLIMGLVASHSIIAVFTGDPSLSKRPMGRVLEPLRRMGADFQAIKDNFLPVTITGAENPLPIIYEMPVASAQVKSAILLAGLNTPGTTTIIEPIATRDHTEKMLDFFGAEITIKTQDGVNHIELKGEAELMAKSVIVPGDPSSAAFAMVAALITKGSDVTIENVLLNPTRFGLIETLIEMGGDIEILNKRSVSGEDIGDLRVKSSALKGVEVPAERAPSMIDEYPILSVAASFAQGATHMKGLGELKVKESDRLAAISTGLSACGVAHQAGHDDLTIMPGKHVPGGGLVATQMDHRIAMAFLVLGFGAKGCVEIDDGSMIATSYPGFVADMVSIGCKITVSGGHS